VAQSEQHIWAVIPAAGSGQRFGSELPKQFLPITGQSVLQHTLDALLAHPHVQGAVVALPATHLDYPLSAQKPVLKVQGGAERAASVLACLEPLSELDPEHLIAVHDAARPCFLPQHLDALFAAALAHPVGAIWGQALSDTLKQCDAEGSIMRTLDRSAHWRAQTPQVFRLGALRSALAHALAQRLPCTDEAQALEYQGQFARVVACPVANPKLTLASDLALLQQFLSAKPGNYS
jgi:2-C-methyl-D-erythritol 4-phosphate cytidylyltransferase